MAWPSRGSPSPWAAQKRPRTALTTVARRAELALAITTSMPTSSTRMVDAPLEAKMRDKARRREILAEISKLGPCLPGSLVSHSRTCNTPGCHCHDDPAALHGPYIAWTRKVAGKTLTRVLSQEQFVRYRPWADNSRRLHELVAELEQLGAESMAEAEGWPPPPPPPPDGRRGRSKSGEKAS